jgi:hypothetical protein
MCFWSHGQSFSGKVYKTKVRVHLPNSKVGQVLTPYSYPGSGAPNGVQATLQPQITHTAASEQSEAPCPEVKITDNPNLYNIL